MTANQTPVAMVGHVWMESTHSLVDVERDSLDHIARLVSVQFGSIS